MNPSYIKRPNDKNAVRNQYMNLLALESANIQKNWNANQIFKETGQTRPNTLPDTRTTTDKRADLERLKLEVRSELSTITDAVIANDIAQKLGEEPELLRFASDQIEFIKRELEIKFKNGVPAAVGISFITKLFRKYQMTEGVEMGIQQNIGGNGSAGIFYNLQDWGQLPSREDYDEMRSEVGSVGGKAANKLSEYLHILELSTPELEFLEKIQQLNPQYSEEIDERLKALLGDRMVTTELWSWIDRIKLYAKTGDRKSAEDLMDQLAGMIYEPEENIGKLRLIEKEFKNSKMEEGAAGGPEWYNAISQSQEQEQLPTAAAAPAGAATATATAEEVPEIAINPRTGKPLAPTPATAILQLSTYADFENLKTRAEAAAFLDANSIEYPKNFTWGKTTKNQLSEEIKQQVRETIAQQQGEKAPAEVGTGLKKKKRIVMGKGLSMPEPKQATPTPFRSRANRLEHLIDKPMEKPKPYTPLGKYVIHKHKLQDGILQIKTAKGGTVGHFPTEAISSELSRVLRKIVGGSMVDFDEINELKDGDKSYLNKIVKTAHLSDKISVPKPDYGREKIELNRFQILKGEIGAGNDNKEMIREFKVLLMKFVNQGRVPRRQAHEILVDLAAQGL